MCMHWFIGVFVINYTESLWYDEYIVDKTNLSIGLVYMYEYVW